LKKNRASIPIEARFFVGAIFSNSLPSMLPILLALLIGAFLTVQLGVNNTLKTGLHAPIWAAFASFFVGACALMLVGLAARTPFAIKTEIPWWAWTGGLLGAVYVALSVVLVDKLGAAALTGCVVAGQIVASLVVDHFGWFSVPQHPISFGRIAGAVLLGVGVWLVKHY